jgi:hypothetical protein
MSVKWSMLHDEIEWRKAWEETAWGPPFHAQPYILRDRGDKTWAVVDNRTREVLATDLTLLAAEGMLKLLKESG